MKFSLVIALLWAFVAHSIPGVAAEGFLEYGPKRALVDSRYSGVVLKSDVPKDLSCSATRLDPRPPFKMSEAGGSDDPRYLLFTPNLGEPPNDKMRAEFINLNSVILSDYSLLGLLPHLREAWICTDKPEQLPQALLNALGTDRALRRLIIRGDLSLLDLSVLGRDLNLDAISLCDPHLSVSNVEQLASIKSLQCLEVEETGNISADCITHLGALNQLRDLRLTANLAFDSDVSVLKRLPKLRRLHVKVGPNTLKQLSELTGLKVLKVFGVGVDANIPALATLKNLVSLEIGTSSGRFGSPTGESLGALRDVPLKYLSVFGCNITPKGFRSIAEIKSLKGLDITWTTPTDEGLMALANLHNLRQLRASCIEQYDGLKELANKLPQCTIQAQTNCPRY